MSLTPISPTSFAWQPRPEQTGSPLLTSHIIGGKNTNSTPSSVTSTPVAPVITRDGALVNLYNKQCLQTFGELTTPLNELRTSNPQQKFCAQYLLDLALQLNLVEQNGENVSKERAELKALATTFLAQPAGEFCLSTLDVKKPEGHDRAKKIKEFLDARIKPGKPDFFAMAKAQFIEPSLRAGLAPGLENQLSMLLTSESAKQVTDQGHASAAANATLSALEGFLSTTPTFESLAMFIKASLAPIELFAPPRKADSGPTEKAALEPSKPTPAPGSPPAAPVQNAGPGGVTMTASPVITNTLTGGSSNSELIEKMFDEVCGLQRQIVGYLHEKNSDLMGKLLAVSNVRPNQPELPEIPTLVTPLGTSVDTSASSLTHETAKSSIIMAPVPPENKESVQNTPTVITRHSEAKGDEPNETVEHRKNRPPIPTVEEFISALKNKPVESVSPPQVIPSDTGNLTDFTIKRSTLQLPNGGLNTSDGGEGIRRHGIQLSEMIQLGPSAGKALKDLKKALRLGWADDNGNLAKYSDISEALKKVINKDKGEKDKTPFEVQLNSFQGAKKAAGIVVNIVDLEKGIATVDIKGEFLDTPYTPIVTSERGGRGESVNTDGPTFSTILPVVGSYAQR
jgi:hypothetical protein